MLCRQAGDTRALKEFQFIDAEVQSEPSVLDLNGNQSLQNPLYLSRFNDYLSAELHLIFEYCLCSCLLTAYKSILHIFTKVCLRVTLLQSVTIYLALWS